MVPLQKSDWLDLSPDGRDARKPGDSGDDDHSACLTVGLRAVEAAEVREIAGGLEDE